MLLVSALFTFDGSILGVLCRNIIIRLLSFQIVLHHWEFLVEYHNRLFDTLQWNLIARAETVGLIFFDQLCWEDDHLKKFSKT